MRVMRVGVACRPAKNWEVSGDTYLLHEWNSQTLAAVIDGLGHGVEAHRASENARGYVEDHAAEDIEEIIRGCDRHIRKTRGVSIGLVRIDRKTDRLSCSGVGNVEMQILNKRAKHLLSMAGIVGCNLRRVRKFEYAYEPVSGILMHSDGVSGRFDLSKYPYLRRDPQLAAERIIEEWGKERDDATILIAVETR